MEIEIDGQQRNVLSAAQLSAKFLRALGRTPPALTHDLYRVAPGPERRIDDHELVTMTPGLRLETRPRPRQEDG